MSEEDRRRFSEVGGYGKLAENITATGYGPDADALHAEVQADDAKDRLIAQLRQSLDDTMAENARQSAANAKLSRELAEARAAIVALTPGAGQPAAASEGGSWKQIGFMGHYEYTGWVTDITRNGVAAYRIELPDYIWGADPDAWVEHSAASWHHTNPASEATIRRAWEAKRARDAEIAEWHAQRQALALEPAGDEDLTNADVDPDAYPDETDTDDEDEDEDE